MGAINFIEFGKGTSCKNAFYQLVAEAEWEYGHDAYNGTISTTMLQDGCTKIADTWNYEAREKACAFADEHGYGEKWESRALDCGVCKDGETMWAFYGWASC